MGVTMFREKDLHHMLPSLMNALGDGAVQRNDSVFCSRNLHNFKPVLLGVIYVNHIKSHQVVYAVDVLYVIAHAKTLTTPHFGQLFETAF